MEAKMKHYTTVEQSKKLVKLGLNPDTADMHYFDRLIHNVDDKRISLDSYSIALEHTYDANDILPCWSLGALMDLMPKIKEHSDDGGCYPVLCKGWNNNLWHCVYRSSIHITKWHYNSLNAAFEMICWLLKNGYIEKIVKEQNGKIKRYNISSTTKRTN